MGWRALYLAVVMMAAACTFDVADPFDRKGEVRNLTEKDWDDAGPDDGGLRDGEMPANVAQEWCWRWICTDARAQGQYDVIDASCGGLTEYDCR